jgi:Domain of unknown function (DUF932)
LIECLPNCTRRMNPQNTNGQFATSLFSAHRTAPSASYPMGFFNDPSVAQLRNPETLSDLVSEFDLSASQQFADVDIPVASLAMSVQGNIVVPDHGPCALTPWAKKQLAGRLGIQWGRWFDGIDPKLRSDEVNRRLARDAGKVRVRTAVGSGNDGESVATLRAFVSTTYATIPDAAVAQAILEELRMGDPKLVRRTSTDRTTSYVVRVGAPFHVGGPAQVGDVVGGLLVRNSDVGYASLVIALHLTRLVCTNGMVVAENKTIVRRAHRRIELEDLKEKLAIGLRDVPARIQRAGRALERSGHHAVEHVEAALVEVLRLARLPLRVLPVLAAAYDRDPHASAFGISQAVTLGAQDPRVSAEERLALETAAGEYVARYAQ